MYMEQYTCTSICIFVFTVQGEILRRCYVVNAHDLPKHDIYERNVWMCWAYRSDDPMMSFCAENNNQFWGKGGQRSDVISLPTIKRDCFSISKVASYPNFLPHAGLNTVVKHLLQLDIV